MAEPLSPDDTKPIHLPVNNAATIAVKVRPQARDRAVFIIIGGHQVGRVLSLPQQAQVTLGRSEEATLRLDDASLSRIHARVMRVGAQLVFQDAGSTNGSSVNDLPASEAHPLKDGDRLLLGQSTALRFQMVDEAEERALQNVYEAAMRDGLTGVLNRKALEERLDAEVAFGVRHGTPLAVIMIDVDHFKKVNDGYGHQAGDLVLRSVAGGLQRGLRTEDVLGRYGGEEFCIVARGIEVAQAVILADRLRTTVAGLTMSHGGQQIRVTSSAGVASLLECGAGRDKTTLIGLADARLYKAKEGGRNRVVGG